MPRREEKHPIVVITACTRSDGLPDFALTEVEVTEEEYANGVAYDLTTVSLHKRGYEEPFVHFDDREAPLFLLPAVKEYLGLDTPGAAPIATP